MTTRRIELIEEKAQFLKGKICTIGTSKEPFLVQEYTYKDGQLTMITDKKNLVYDAVNALKALEEFRPVPQDLPAPDQSKETNDPQQPAMEEIEPTSEPPLPVQQKPMTLLDLNTELEPLVRAFKKLGNRLEDLQFGADHKYSVSLYHAQSLDEEFSAEIYQKAIAQTRGQMDEIEGQYIQKVSSYLQQKPVQVIQ
ncbi:hypothetical protein [Telluribacter humicola]|uniref:hypothetical protein n=1 Tax=Telluribacter humicola TaxID=1720261 RepID=UPI001A95ABE5|nr:hypothetical protein [Telluribacter humicola]